MERSTDPATTVRALATAIFGSPRRAAAWMQSPSLHLGDRTPDDCLDTAEGIAEVRAELIRIQHGDY